MTWNVGDPLWLAELVVFDRRTLATTTLRLSNKAFTTGSGETPASTWYDDRIDQAVDIRRTMFSGGDTMGRSTSGIGDLLLKNLDGLLDDWNDWYAFDGRAIVVRLSTVVNPAYPSDFTSWTFTMEQPLFSSNQVRVKLHDRQEIVATIPLQRTKYAGTNVLPAGLEGTASDLKGKPKPVALGIVDNAEIPRVNTSKEIFQANDGALASVDAVYDRGTALIAGSAYATLADLLDDAQAPAAGSYKAYLAGGYIRLGSAPVGLVTADFTQGTNAAARTAGQMYAALLTRAGLSSGDWSATDITTLDGLNSAVLGYWSGLEETTCADVIDKVAGTVGAWWGCDRLGVFRIQRLDTPVGITAVKTFVESDVKEDSFQKLTVNDVGDGIPLWKITLRWGHNLTVQNVDFLETATYATVAPTNPATDDLWVDTSVTPNVWNRWSGSAWVKITPTAADEIAETAALKWAAEHGAEVTTGKSVDILADGSTYARTKASELSSGQVKQAIDTVESTTLTTNQLRRETIMWSQVL